MPGLALALCSLETAVLKYGARFQTGAVRTGHRRERS